MKPIHFLLLANLWVGCQSGSHEQREGPTNSTSISKEDSGLLAEVNAKPDNKSLRLHRFTEFDVARFTIAAVMNQPPEIISATKSGGEYLVSYNHPSDGQRFTYKVRLDGPRAVWGNVKGRWRDSPDDAQITYTETDDQLKITQNFSDGSEANELFFRF